MTKSTLPIIRHIPDFLEYYKNNGYSFKTQENYKHYLHQFILWLEKNNKRAVKPHELTSTDILHYKTYLNSSYGQNGRALSVTTQNYYLIALRALLGYFMAQDVVSIVPDKIILPRPPRAGKIANFLTEEQVGQLLKTPNIKEVSGLRDRAILETIISTGFKVNKIANLDISQLNELPPEALIWIKKYLKTRKDKKEAIFINYRARHGSLGGKLTNRSIERIVSYYGMKIGIPFPVKPELLRWARIHALLDDVIEIKNPQTHKLSKIKQYILVKNNPPSKSKIPSSWTEIEKIINNEILWLKNSIPVLPENYKENPSFLRHDEIIWRKLATLIVSGKIKATEFLAEDDNLWNSPEKSSSFEKISRHGHEWHKKMMDTIYYYFKTAGYNVIMEPHLNQGRADLGIYPKSNTNIYIEVDTVSLFKLWYNLLTMKNSTFLIIPSKNKIIEFNN